MFLENLLANRRLLLITAGLCVGIVISRCWHLPVGAGLFLAVLCLLLTVAACRYRPRYLTGLILLCAVLTGSLWYGLSQYPGVLYKDLAGQTVEGKGLIITYPRPGETGLSFVVRVQELVQAKEKVRLAQLEKLLLRVKAVPEHDAAKYLPGTFLVFQGELVLPGEPRNPGEFNYRAYLANQGIFYQVDCRREQVNGEKVQLGLRSLAAQGRAKVAAHLEKLLPQRERGLLLGLLFGDVTAISKADWEGYQRAGVLHLFAVSGFNVAIILGVTFFLLSVFVRIALVRIMVGVFVLCGYYFLVGWTASIVRASLMAFVGMLALLSRRKKDVFTGLALAALVILTVNPGELFQVSFQLSFAATIGIVYLVPFLESRGMGKTLATTLAAQAATLPLITCYFNLVSLAAPLLNVLAVLVSGLVTVLGMLGVLLFWLFPPLAQPFFLVSGFLLYLLSELILKVAAYDWAALVVPSPPLLLILLYYLFLAALPVLPRINPYLRFITGRLLSAGRKFLFFSWQQGKRSPLSVSVSIIVLLALFGAAAYLVVHPPRSAKMTVTFLDVGQGESIFIKTPGKRTVLVDGGGTPGGEYQVGLKTVGPFLKRQGLDRVDIMVMSHHHLDHSEGLGELLPQLAVGCFLMPPREGHNPVERAILDLCEKKNVPVKELVAGLCWQLDKDTYLEVLHPAAGDGTGGNNHSLVLRLVYQDTQWLLTGDVENAAIAELLKRGYSLEADILKLPHHGSLTSFSPELYRRVNPRLVVVSAGFNFYNQPHPLVLEYFGQNRIPVYLTKEKGAVITESDGKKITVRTMLP